MRSKTWRSSAAPMRSRWMFIASVSTSRPWSSGRSAIRFAGRANPFAPIWREGFGRQGRSPADFERFVVMAMGSADEMRIWIRYCRDLGYVDAVRGDHWQEEYQDIARMLAGLLRQRARARASS